MTLLHHHHDTTHEPRLTRERYERVSRDQEATVVAWLAQRGGWWSREAIEYEFGLPPQTVSRILANQTKAGKLEKSPAANSMSSYGRRVHSWTCARPNKPTQGDLL